MEFKDNKAIYLQIVDFICERILLGEWPLNEKVPSVRELAVSMEVNPNTVMRSYDLLQNMNIIQNKRGVGFFLEEKAIESVKAYKKGVFMDEEIPPLYRSMYLLQIGFDELEKGYETFVKTNFKTN
ncbi:MAG: GntR family transcriptional regulator [Pedobacter sp.]|nr:MAG: GntR family transcriptional regulator [Pedobacter sp.]